MDAFTEIAKLFKDRENKNWSGVQIGTIVSVSPLQVRLNEFILLNSKHLYLTEMFNSRIKNNGDKVMIIPSSNEQIYFVIDKVV